MQTLSRARSGQRRAKDDMQEAESGGPQTREREASINNLPMMTAPTLVHPTCSRFS